MNYPHFIDYKSSENKYYKFYDIDIVERNCIYPFTYNNANDTKYNIIENIIENHIKNDINVDDFIQLPMFENLMIDANGLPYIPLNK